MDAAAIGAAFRKSTKTGNRFLKSWTGTVYKVNGRRYIAEVDFQQWLEGQKTERTAPKASLRSMIDEIAEKVLRDRSVQASTLERRRA